ncbi:hypothetical protein PIB30_018433, partial [Stylosanthes scabra]|nr:hypothetical protein [Stylosanthes scabra]
CSTLAVMDACCRSVEKEDSTATMVEWSVVAGEAFVAIVICRLKEEVEVVTIEDKDKNESDLNGLEILCLE